MGNYLSAGLPVGLLLSITLLAQGEDPQSLDFLIFRNGATLSGHVVREGDWYSLRSDNGQGESRYPVGTVLTVCQGSKATYLWLKERIRNDEAQDHCRLARFCVTQGLNQEARDEIQSALKLDRTCMEARSLLAQLESKSAKTEACVPELPTPTIAPLPAARLEDWPQIATQGGFIEYSKRIQPILLNGCGTSACHGTAEGKRAFILTRGLYGAAPSPLTSRTNLERVLGLIDKEHPEESPLLKRALQMHGGAKTSLFMASDQATFQQLQAWVATVCGIKPEAIAKNNQSNGNITQTGFASGEAENKSAGSPLPFAAPERSDGSSTPGETKRNDQSFGVGTPSLSPNPIGQGDKGSAGQGAGVLPTIPGLSGKAASQLGQPTPPQSNFNNSNSPIPDQNPEAKKQPLKNLKEDPGFLNYSRQLGAHPTIPGPDREPPRQIRVQSAGSFEIRTPAPPDIPEEFKRPPLAKEPPDKDDKGKELRPLNNGTIVNPPKQ